METWYANSSTVNTPTTMKHSVPMATDSFPVPTLLISICCSNFQLDEHFMRPRTRANMLICLLNHAYEAPLANIKMEHLRWPEKPLILGRSGTQYFAMVTKLLSSYCVAHVVESCCKESNTSETNWPRSGAIIGDGDRKRALILLLGLSP